MSTFFAENNSESAFELFNKRTYYKGTAANSLYSNLLSFDAEKLMYGRVDRFFVPMIATSENGNLKTFSTTNAQEENLRALNFVVDAFEAMAQQFRKCALIGKIDTKDPFLTNLKVYKAYEDPKIRYQQYLNQYKQIVRGAASKKTHKIRDFDEKYELLMEK